LVAARRREVPTVVTLHDYWFFCPRLTLLRSDGQVCSGSVSPTECAWCLRGEQRRFQSVARLRRQLGDRLGSRDAGVWRQLAGQPLVEVLAQRQDYVTEALRLVDTVVSPAPFALSLLAAADRPPERLAFVRLGLDAPVSTPARPHREGPLRVGYLGQIAPHKGVHLLADAVAHLTGVADQIELAIYGDMTRSADYALRLQRTVATRSNIRLMGAYDNARVAEMLASLDVVVVPSTWYEVSPIVILEAFAAGVPVIASDFPNLASLVHDEQNGLLFAPGDATDLARQLRRLIEEPGLRDRLARGVRPVRSVASEIDEIEAIYRSVLAQPPALARAEETRIGSDPAAQAIKLAREMAS
jgi:glycosyltransferase involved in cell wall biosynthesis